jgi:D-beta-D-heptose 7-phosphate kinase / D-beta-D-heptose 1-phosphate adenosyltransferase
MFILDETLKLVGRQTVLCVGDVMLDDFVYGEVNRISPEAPVQVLTVSNSELVVGGAGNVARNVAALGARCIFVSVIGDDEAARTLKSALAAEASIESNLVVDGTRPTTRKVRFVSEHHSTHLLRADWERVAPISGVTEQAVIDAALEALPRVAAVVLSDYAKGVLTPRVVRTLIDAARKANKPLIVDPKGKDFSSYAGATLITPNSAELAEVSRHAVATEADVVAAVAELNRLVKSEAVLVTRGEQGMMLVQNGAGRTGQEPISVPAHSVKVRDVSGAGDTVVAVLAAMVAAGMSFEDAMMVANAAAAVVVGKRGTATVSPAELRARMQPSGSRAHEDKIVFDWSVLDQRLDEWHRQGLRIGFTNGCFDLLHPGHIKLLAGASAACDALIVGLNSDASVRRLKGPERPMQDVYARAEVLAALAAVDLVVVFEEDTPLELIRRVRPKVLVKGGDYTREQVVGHDIVERDGGEVLLVDVVPGYSTTRLVQKSRQPQPT